MIPFFKNKTSYLVVLSTLIAVFFLVVEVPSPTFASPSTATIARTTISSSEKHGGNSLFYPLQRQHRPLHDDGNNQVNNQYYRGRSNGGSSLFYRGKNQGNSGNQGSNLGNNQDNGGNNSNQVNNQGNTIGMQVNSQESLINSQDDLGDDNGGSDSYYLGYNQGNSGNQGLNLGNNQDNSGNSSNQVNNQGNTIGMQINSPESQVNNQGSIIEHQINYIILDRHMEDEDELWPFADFIHKRCAFEAP